MKQAISRGLSVGARAAQWQAVASEDKLPAKIKLLVAVADRSEEARGASLTRTSRRVIR